MPILEFHLTEGQQSDEQVASLMREASLLYAEVLESPIERVRVYVTEHKARHVAVGGRLVSEGAPAAPYFHFLVLEGRPVEQCHHLMAGFTDLCERHLGVDRKLVRGGCNPIAPHYWAIAGQPASGLRAAEIQARASEAASGAFPASPATASVSS